MTSPITVLFDLSFEKFITTRIIKLFFILGIIGAGLMTLAFIVAGFNVSSLVGAIVLLLSPILFVIYVLLVRLWCEFIIVVFRIAENTHALVQRGSGPKGAPVGGADSSADE